jgi:hypothetical protein
MRTMNKALAAGIVFLLPLSGFHHFGQPDEPSWWFRLPQRVVRDVAAVSGSQPASGWVVSGWAPTS